jgi:hypothetical protein
MRNRLVDRIPENVYTLTQNLNAEKNNGKPYPEDFQDDFGENELKWLIT